MSAVSKTRQLQCMLVNAMRRSPWRAGNHRGALSQRSFCDRSRERNKASSRPGTCLLQHATHFSQHSIKSCVFSTTLNTPHAGIHQKNVPCSVHSRCVKNKLRRQIKSSTSQRNLPGCQCETASNSGFYFLAKKHSSRSFPLH